ncbi:MAG: helix-turn-helix transcriptional regulator [Pseudomonadota bacterium]
MPHDNFYEQMGRRIAELRKSAANISQERLAERASIAASYVAHIEIGSRKPTLDVLRRIAVALDVPVWRLIVDERLSVEEQGWQEAAQRLAADVRGLPVDDLTLLSVVARKCRAAARLPVPPPDRLAAGTGPQQRRQSTARRR